MMSGPLLQVKEDRIKPQKQETDTSSEPTKRRRAKRHRVEPNAQAHPALRLAVVVIGIRDGEEEGREGGYGDDGGDVADCVVEADGADEEFGHDGVD